MTEAIKISEDELQTCVIDLAHLLGWRVMHTRPAMNRHGKWLTPLQGDPGFPDIVAVRERVIWIELKSETGRLSVPQQDWLFALGAADQERYVWRPYQWFNGEIEKVLRASLRGET